MPIASQHPFLHLDLRARAMPRFHDPAAATAAAETAAPPQWVGHGAPATAALGMQLPFWPPLPAAEGVQSAHAARGPMTVSTSASEQTIEVHDARLRAPVSTPLAAVIPTRGLERAFSASSHVRGDGTTPSARQQMRACERFVAAGECALGPQCVDVHVMPHVWAARREEALRWLETAAASFAALPPNATFRIYCAEIKEIIDVPAQHLTFTRGLYLDPAVRAKRSHAAASTSAAPGGGGGGHHDASPFAVLTSQVPTACGLFSASPHRCRWGQWCNQAHVDGVWLQRRCAEFVRWSAQLESEFARLPATHVFVLHDPEERRTLSIAKSELAEFSRGLFQGSAAKAPSVCMLFQRRRCTAGACCNQAHVAPATLAQARRTSRGIAAPLDANAVVVAVAPRQRQPRCLNPEARPFEPIARIDAAAMAGAAPGARDGERAEALVLRLDAATIWSAATAATRTPLPLPPSQSGEWDAAGDDEFSPEPAAARAVAPVGPVGRRDAAAALAAPRGALAESELNRAPSPLSPNQCRAIFGGGGGDKLFLAPVPAIAGGAEVEGRGDCHEKRTC